MSGRGGRSGGGGYNAPPQSVAAAPQPEPAASLSHEMEQKLMLKASSSQGPQTQGPPAAENPPPVQPELPPASSKAVRYPQRPGFGSDSQKVVVKANHFLTEIGNRDLHHYDVSISPEVTSKKVCREILNQLVTNYKNSHLGKRMLAYDGRKSCYTASELPFESKDFVVKLNSGDSQSRRERKFKVSIKFVAKVDLHHLQQFMQGRQLDLPHETFQLYDVVLRENPSNSCAVVGRSFFSPMLGDRGELGNGLMYWKGFYQSLRPTQMGLSLNIDMSARAFFEPIWVSEYVQKNINNDLSRGLSDQDRIKVKKALKGVRVETEYLGQIRRHKIKGITTMSTQQLMFSLDGMEAQISVAQYFIQQYDINLQYPSLPAIQAGSDTKPIYLPMELCKIVEGQRFSRKLNERQVTALLKATCQCPKDRESSILQMVREIDYNNDKLVNEQFGIHVRSEMVTPSEGQWNMIDKAGGRNSVLEFAVKGKFPYLSDPPTIIFGANVTHPQPVEDSSPSTAVVVASTDWPEVKMYRALVSAQAHREEIIQDLYSMVREHLLAFYKSTKLKPHRLIFYRDGVSEGQISQVLFHEMEAISNACSSIEENYMPGVTFIVVQNHNDENSTDRSGNILPGTVVDTKICHPTEFDFYLCSDAGIQGTSCPTHYHVLYDENEFTADGLQMLTNSLCYTNAGCTRSVSLVAPAFYARLAAFRARNNIEDTDFSDS